MDYEWFKCYKLNVDELDKDHFELIEMFESLKSAINKQEDISLILIKFYNLMETHFNTEEQLMIKVNFPYSDYHKTVHDHIKTNIKRLISDCNKKKLNCKYFISNLEKMLITHIDHYDRQISDFILQQK